MKQVVPAYIAGLADSDGSFTITIMKPKRPTPYYRSTFQLGWKKSDKALLTLEQIKTKYGGSISEFKSTSNINEGILVVKYFLSGAKLVTFIKDCLPFLHLKRSQARLILFLESSRKEKHGRNKRKPIKIKEYQHGLYLKIKSLNTKNSGSRCKS